MPANQPPALLTVRLFAGREDFVQFVVHYETQLVRMQHSNRHEKAQEGTKKSRSGDFLGSDADGFQLL